mmetsp:Transcript_18056/g.51307  ORF Transcript_18056/g.51307 Transcript_18056/m.51307 type:complete len:426 (-) Transcript_18056:806-2083(-)
MRMLVRIEVDRDDVGRQVGGGNLHATAGRWCWRRLRSSRQLIAMAGPRRARPVAVGHAGARFRRHRAGALGGAGVVVERQALARQWRGPGEVVVQAGDVRHVIVKVVDVFHTHDLSKAGIDDGRFNVVIHLVVLLLLLLLRSLAATGEDLLPGVLRNLVLQVRWDGINHVLLDLVDGERWSAAARCGALVGGGRGRVLRRTRRISRRRLPCRISPHQGAGIVRLAAARIARVRAVAAVVGSVTTRPVRASLAAATVPVLAHAGIGIDVRNFIVLAPFAATAALAVAVTIATAATPARAFAAAAAATTIVVVIVDATVRPGGRASEVATVLGTLLLALLGPDLVLLVAVLEMLDEVVVVLVVGIFLFAKQGVEHLLGDRPHECVLGGIALLPVLAFRGGAGAAAAVLLHQVRDEVGPFTAAFILVG